MQPKRKIGYPYNAADPIKYKKDSMQLTKGLHFENMLQKKQQQQHKYVNNRRQNIKYNINGDNTRRDGKHMTRTRQMPYPLALNSIN